MAWRASTPTPEPGIVGPSPIRFGRRLRLGQPGSDPPSVSMRSHLVNSRPHPRVLALLLAIGLPFGACPSRPRVYQKPAPRSSPAAAVANGARLPDRLEAIAGRVVDGRLFRAEGKGDGRCNFIYIIGSRSRGWGTVGGIKGSVLYGGRPTLRYIPKFRTNVVEVGANAGRRC